MKKGDLIKFATVKDGDTTKFIFKVGAILGVDEDGRTLVNIDNGIAFFVPKEEECAECEVQEQDPPPFDLKCVDEDVIQFEPEWLPVKEHFKNLNLTFDRVIKVGQYEIPSVKDFDTYDEVVGYYSSI